MKRQWVLGAGIVVLSGAAVLILSEQASAQYRDGGRFGRPGSGYGNYDYQRYGYGSPYNSGYGQPGSYNYGSNYNYNQGNYGSQPPMGYNSYYPSDSYATQMNNGSALIALQVPPTAQIWFDGQQTQQKGSVREFITPPLERGQNFTYKVRVKWMENGKDMDQTKNLSVQAGQRKSLNFGPNRGMRGDPMMDDMDNNPRRLGDSDLDRSGDLDRSRENDLNRNPRSTDTDLDRNRRTTNPDENTNRDKAPVTPKRPPIKDSTTPTNPGDKPPV